MALQYSCMLKFASALLLCALSAFAAIDGVWTAKATPKKGDAVAFSLEFKTKNDRITGTVMMEGKKKPVVASIQNAKLEGDRLTFTTVVSNKKGVTTTAWDLQVEPERLTGTRTKEGARKGTPFVAKRSKQRFRSRPHR